MAVTGNTRFVLGVDVGGTSIKPQLFKVVGGSISEVPLWEPEEAPKTRKGVAAHAAQIADIINQAQKKSAEFSGTLIAVGVGAPGRFNSSSADPRISPGSSPNMGITRDEFDGVNLKAEYQRELDTLNISIPLYIANDGNAMLSGMLDKIQSPTSDLKLQDQHGSNVTKTSILKNIIALIGIGTGVGHAIAEVDGKGGFNFVTDGHASKLRIKVDPEDWALLMAADSEIEDENKKIGVANALLPPDSPERKEKTDRVVFFAETLEARAEDLMRAPVINAMLKVLGAEDGPQALEFAGKYMARLIAQIKSGESTDIVPDYGWNAADKEKAAETGIYLIGGAIAAKHDGEKIVQLAAEELKKLRITDIKLVRYTGENVAARAAATMIPADVYRGASRSA